MPGDRLLSEFEAAVSREPTNFSEMVLPYALLVAMFLIEDNRPLIGTTRVVADPRYKWLDEMRQFLIEMHRPVSHTHFETPLFGSNISVSSDAPTTRKAIVFPP
jgi:hypothetical protein